MHVRRDMVFCFVVRPAGSGHEFLQMRRAPGRYLEGVWQTVAGTIEVGETAAEAALRELREETGLRPAEFYQLDGVNTFFIAAADTMFHCPCFCAIVEAGAEPRLNEEHDASRWVERGKAAEAFLWPGERVAVREACEAILDGGEGKGYLRMRDHGVGT